MLPNSENRYIKSSKLKAVNISSTASLPDPKNVQLLLIHGVPKDEIIVPQCCEIRCLSAKTLTAELKQKNARTAVRRDFIVAHPRPKMRMIFENITNFRAIPSINQTISQSVLGIVMTIMENSQESCTFTTLKAGGIYESS